MEDPACCTEADLGALAPFGVQHDLRLALRDARAWESMSSLLQRAGADVENVRVSQVRDGVAVSCRLKSISSALARGLAGRALDDGLVRRASVEHVLLAGGGR